MHGIVFASPALRWATPRDPRGYRRPGFTTADPLTRGHRPDDRHEPGLRADAARARRRAARPRFTNACQTPGHAGLMDGGWDDLVHDLTLDLDAMEQGQFVIVQHCALLDPNPYVQAAPDGAGGWYCEVVSEAYLPATVWPIDGWYLMAAGWTPPTDPRDNWSRTADSPAHAAQLLADGLRYGRVCPDWQPVIWRTAWFPRPPDDGPEDPPADLPPNTPGAHPRPVRAAARRTRTQAAGGQLGRGGTVNTRPLVR